MFHNKSPGAFLSPLYELSCTHQEARNHRATQFFLSAAIVFFVSFLVIFMQNTNIMSCVSIFLYLSATTMLLNIPWITFPIISSWGTICFKYNQFVGRINSAGSISLHHNTLSKRHATRNPQEDYIKHCYSILTARSRVESIILKSNTRKTTGIIAYHQYIAFPWLSYH